MPFVPLKRRDGISKMQMQKKKKAQAPVGGNRGNKKIVYVIKEAGAIASLTEEVSVIVGVRVRRPENPRRFMDSSRVVLVVL